MARVVVRSARMPSPTSMMPSAIAAPTATATEIVRPTSPRPTGSTLALSMATRSSGFMFGLPRDKGRQCAQAPVNVNLDTRFRDAAPLRCLRYAPPFKLHALDRAPYFFRQPPQKFSDVVGAFGICTVVLRHDLRTLIERDARSGSGPAQIVDELVSSDSMHPGRKWLPDIVGVALEMDSQQHFLHQIFSLRRAASDAGEFALVIGRSRLLSRSSSDRYDAALPSRLASISPLSSVSLVVTRRHP